MLTAFSFKNDFFFMFPNFTFKSYTYSQFFFTFRQHTVRFKICKQMFFFMVSNFDSNLADLFFDYTRYLSSGIFLNPVDRLKVKVYGVYGSFFFSPSTYLIFFRHLVANYDFMYFRFFNYLFCRYFKLTFMRVVEFTGNTNFSEV